MTAEASREIRVAASFRERLTPRRLFASLIILSFALVVVSLIAISVGSERIGVETIASILWRSLTGQVANVSQDQWTIVMSIRLPRVVAAIVVGGALSVAGAAYQGLLRNPLADPYILGISTGGALGAILATIYASAWPIARPAAAFAGAVITIALVYFLGQTRQGGSSERLILAGIITNTFLSSAVIFLLTAASGAHLQSIFAWLIGDLSGAGRLLPLVAVLSIAGIAVIYVNARSLNLLMIGEEEALILGVEVRRVKLILFLTASLITGAVTAISGVIGFVGLVIPHAIRLVSGSDNRLVVPASALGGAAFLLLADTLARTVAAPTEIHVGVITALVGAPAFIYLLRRTS